MHTRLLFRNQSQKCQYPTHCLVIYHRKCHNPRKSHRPRHFVLENCIHHVIRHTHCDIRHCPMIKLNKGPVFKKVFPKWFMVKRCLRNQLSIHIWPCIVPNLSKIITLFRRQYQRRGHLIRCWLGDTWSLRYRWFSFFWDTWYAINYWDRRELVWSVR